MHNNVNFGVWRVHAYAFHCHLLDALAQIVNLLEGKGARRRDNHVGEKLVACPAHADTPHLGNASSSGARSTRASIVSLARRRLTQSTMPETPRAAIASACPNHAGRWKMMVRENT